MNWVVFGDSEVTELAVFKMVIVQPCKVGGCVFNPGEYVTGILRSNMLVEFIFESTTVCTLEAHDWNELVDGGYMITENKYEDYIEQRR